MKIVFMGTPEFAVASLDLLLKNNFDIVAVVTAPDRPSGRGQQMHQSPVKQYAIQNELYLLQPENLKAQEFVDELRILNADVQFVVAFRMLPEIVWNMPKEGTFNLHASLLPKYRGAAPINWAIINGEEESGVTTFKLKHEIDTGNILFQEKVKILITDTAGDLHDKLMVLGADLVLKTAYKISDKLSGGEELKFQEQLSSLANHAPKIFKDQCRINWDNPAKEIYNLIRGLSPYPTAFTQLVNGNTTIKTIKIFFANFTIAAHNCPAGTVDTDHNNFLKVYCKDGFLEITDIQLEGKRRMLIREFLKGFEINAGAKMVG